MDSINTQINLVTPWLWYLIRSAGILAFSFLWLALFLGLAIRNPILKKIIEPIYSVGFHCFLAFMAGFWVLVHIITLYLDKQFPLSLADIFIPWHVRVSFVDTSFLACGIIAFYLIIILIGSSYLRKYYKRWMWRIMHYLSPFAFIFVVIHGFFNGTDMKNIYISAIFISSSVILLALYASNLLFALVKKIKPAKRDDQVGN